MQAKEVIQLMQHNRQPTLDLLPELDALTAEYPWFSIAHQLKLKVLKAFDEEVFTNQLPIVAAYTTNRGQLHNNLANKFLAETGSSLDDIFYYQPDEVEIPTAEKEIVVIVEEPPAIQIEVTNYFALEEEEPLTNNEEVFDKNEYLLEKFISANPRIIPRQQAEDNTESIKLADIIKGIASESLAEIYIAQKLYDKAIAVYKDLSLQNPKKRAYFAALIKKVKEIQ